MIPAKPANEQQRLATLRGYEILDTEPEAAFDDLTLLASYVCQTPVAFISLVDADRQWFKSRVGVSVTETSRDIAFCASAILQPDVFIVPDATQDERFAHNPLVVSEPKIRFYAGATLMTDGQAMGTLCVVDRVPRELSSEQLDALRALRRQTLAQLELRRNLKRLEQSLAARDRAEAEKEHTLRELKTALANIHTLEKLEEELRQLVDFVPQLVTVLGPDGKYIHANRVAREYTGMTVDDWRSVDLIGRLIHPDDVEKMRALRKRGLSANDPFEIEARMRGKDGVYRWFLFRYNPLVEQGSVKRWYATGTEIESRKQEEERVRKENVRLEERTRIAQELHDTLLQTFLSASMQLGVALDGVPPDSLVKPRLDRILQLMNQGIEEGRNTIQSLRSSGSDTLDLVLALSRVQQELAVSPDIDFRVSVAGRQQPLQLPIRQEIYRVGREALINAFCHSRAKRVEFELEYGDSELRMRVRDNGCGIDAQVLHSGREGHWGLAGMRERTAKIGGLLKISSSAAGTEVQLSIPSGIAFQLSPTQLVNGT